MKEETKALCILAGAVISSQYGKTEDKCYEDTMEHAKRFMKEIK